MIIEICMDALNDTIKLVPFLFITYLAMEYLEHRMKATSRQMVKKAGKFGPFIGSIVGMFPQCGFSAAASGFYAGGVISVGTLLAIFLSTSDEMLPIFLSESVSASIIWKILIMKVVLGAFTGFLIDFVWKRVRIRRPNLDIRRHREHNHDACEKEHCGCGKESIFLSALTHTVQITVFLFLISLVIGFLVETVGREQIANIIVNRPVFGVMLAGLVGMIPNCAASVIITQLYLSGILGVGQLMAGLLAGAGVGLLVLFRTNKGIKENLLIAGTLYGVSVIWGILIEMIGIIL